MDFENTGDRPLSIEEGVLALRQSREDHAKQESQDETPEDTEEVTEELTEEVTDEASDDAEVEETEEGDEEDQSEDDAEDESGESLYEVDGIEFTKSQLEEWRRGGLREDDYTRKSQANAERSRELDAREARFATEQQQVIDHLNQQKAQLQEALATYAIEQDPEPKSADFPEWKDYSQAKSDWDARNEKRESAKAAHQALVAQQKAEVAQRELQLTLQHIPEWQNPEAFQAGATAVAELGQTYGFSQAEMAALADHRMIRVMHDLVSLRAGAVSQKNVESAAAKKVVKAKKKLAPGEKPRARSEGEKQKRQTMDRLRKTGSRGDAVAAMRARRS